MSTDTTQDPCELLTQEELAGIVDDLAEMIASAGTYRLAMEADRKLVITDGLHQDILIRLTVTHAEIARTCVCD